MAIKIMIADDHSMIREGLKVYWNWKEIYR